MTPPKFDDTYLGFSDNLAQEEELLSWEEMKLVADHRFRQAGEPWDKLNGWLSDHQVYPKRATSERRVMSLDVWGMRGLMRATREWQMEAREEQHPYGADLV